MSAHQESTFTSNKFVDPTPLPANVPKVEEVGATSAPLKSASFFIGQYCREYNDDFMLCKNENNDPAHCLKEGRKVTRCAIDLITKLRENCGKEFDAHWQCLENHNQELFNCRKPERTFNTCVFEKLGLEKKIPGSPEGQEQVHNKKNPSINIQLK
ncbi:NDUFA8, NADH-ubiquinone oxidoreductase complex I 19kd subunit [Phycomyces blakesleeanus]|uniref:NADH-ubiquinone oxidoreductase n=2 Tax=Phycomyces blakesleeanus TaxID=4837 RepID=A0A167P3Z0_PHYB8|nr:NDUFA8, NADH-ubiquinone oxidoreductase complex I 19kd subunit [Phycomyces blakesleeanus NRRL 1555(-)]OAD77204.1 NDUFA8, NADH-ubiquinone oxidoreductase complex I 19kd subunit [Phycomyces blakesleeanus NRRL 1555(-)]|eukprot:XP_018295244.1 NDUFA8, NADH-ubiquinone oxidoreductase complex I 19kd subunit [Phycomyces blakesleeanus NRRL 1555(-)]